MGRAERWVPEVVKEEVGGAEPRRDPQCAAGATTRPQLQVAALPPGTGEADAGLPVLRGACSPS